MGQQPGRMKKVRDYTIIEELGKGAFGVVYKARNSKGMLFAVKSMLNSTNQEVTEKELEMAAHISKHDNIVSIHEHFTEKGPAQEIYIVMEFCEGGDLNDYVINNKPGLPERFGFLVDMARGVNYLHSIKVIHRDLKPQNILMAKTGDKYTCKVSDFGISKVQTAGNDYFTTQCGTIAYVAPEVMLGKYTYSADVFALGLLYFALMAGIILNNNGEKLLVPAIEVGGRPQILADLVRLKRLDRAQFVASSFPFSEALGDLVLSMVDFDPDKRPAMDLVIAKVAELKGAHSAKGAFPDAGAEGARAERLDVLNMMLMQCLADLQQAFTERQRPSRRSRSEEEDDVYMGSFQEDAVLGVIRVKRGVFDSGVGFDDMGSFEEDISNGIIKVAKGGSDSGVYS